MYRELEAITLPSGEVVPAAVITGPDPDWADRIEPMLSHKGEPWTWQNRALLRESIGLEARFFILHRAGKPFANIMLAERHGVALLGHVWTEPADRGGGASSHLMRLLLDDFRRRSGRAIFLGTDFDSTPWHFYQRRGFVSVYPGSGYMGWWATGREAFEQSWIETGEAVVEPLGWEHWAAAAPLLLDGGGGVVRIAATGLFGPGSSEASLLPLLRDQACRREQQAPPSAFVLRAQRSNAVLGIAASTRHPLWPGFQLIDLFCHTRWWHRAADLLAHLPGQPAAGAAYTDSSQPEKERALKAAGFAEAALLPDWLDVPPTVRAVDLKLWRRAKNRG